ncbi:hypothetical protein CC78DRAFT_541142 [Lojkania enalia]|uniref:Uncharacterized protein n=1 Tax=Lojkania enalia TaxID=147567 RepID=A0A9P4N931_9PLEO|nr:hypothetical protein CC78DRAFT_541142 [Didymosphaeria enalia]
MCFTKNTHKSGTWLDFYPLNENSHGLDAALAARIDKVYESLKEIQISVQNRELLIELSEKDPLYRSQYPRNRKWRREAEVSNQAYYALREEVEKARKKVTEKQIAQWESNVERLLEETLSKLDKIAYGDRWGAWKENTERIFKTEDWDWESGGKKDIRRLV